MRKKFSHDGFVRPITLQGDPEWVLNVGAGSAGHRKDTGHAKDAEYAKGAEYAKDAGHAKGAEYAKDAKHTKNVAAGDSPALRFLYRTAPGRMLLQLFVHPYVSKAAGYFLSSRASKWLAPYYIRKHDIDMKGVEIPREGFASFNDFFTRKRTTALPPASEGDLISPCDGWLSFVKIRDHTVMMIKATRFSLGDLLGDDELAEQFRNGDALIFRLTPANYHRYCYAADGQVLAEKKIKGILHCVRPIALRGIPVFAQNSREYQVIRTNRFGTMVQMEIGALLVGKISNHDRIHKLNTVQAGTEKGYFEFGGSTIVLLFKKGMIQFPMEAGQGIRYGGEMKVHMGECIAKAKQNTVREANQVESKQKL